MLMASDGMKKSLLVFSIALCLTLLPSCGSGAPAANDSDAVDEQRISELENQLAEANTELARLRADIEMADSAAASFPSESCEHAFLPVSVLYVGYEQKRRFVPGDAAALWMPYDGAPQVSMMLPNVVVEVLFAGMTGNENDNETWLFVLFPTYDTPMDNRGWISESATQPYTKETQKSVQGDVYVKEGSPVTMIDPENGGDMPLNMDVRGYIEERDGDRLKISGAGGIEFWVDAGYVTYPEIG
jgi:hypothetical protein